MFSLNPQSGIPLYRQLMEQVRRLVSSGQLKPGDSLPSVRELAVAHAVNPMTISKAYSLLEAENLLERQRGKGMIVSTQGRLEEGRNDRLRRLAPAIEQLAVAASQLELAPRDVLEALRRRLEDEDEERRRAPASRTGERK